MSSEAKVTIPEQWREQYELNKKYLALPISDPKRNDMQAILRSDAVQMAEELASLTAEIAMSTDHADILRDRAIRAEAEVESLTTELARLAKAKAEVERLKDYSQYCEKHASDCERGHLKSATCVRCLLTKATEMRLESETEVELLRNLIAATYQFVGAIHGPVRFLNALSNAAQGHAFDTEGLLPYPATNQEDGELQPIGLRSANELLRKRVTQLEEALRICEHKIDQHLQGQYPNGEALGGALKEARAALAL